MKKLSAFCLLLIAGITACKQNESHTTKADTTARQFIKPVNKFEGIQFASKKDTSCGMPLSAGLEDTVHFKNKVYGFCSKECKDEFVKTLQKENKR